MTEKNHDKELDALKADMARLREDIAALAAGVKLSPGAGRVRQDQNHGEEDQGLLSSLLHKFDASRVQSEKVIRDLSTEVEHHPLVSIMAAFGLGYIIAKVWYRGTINEDTHDAA